MLCLAFISAFTLQLLHLQVFFKDFSIEFCVVCSFFVANTTSISSASGQLTPAIVYEATVIASCMENIIKTKLNFLNCQRKD